MTSYRYRECVNRLELKKKEKELIWKSNRGKVFTWHSTGILLGKTAVKLQRLETMVRFSNEKPKVPVKLGSAITAKATVNKMPRLNLP